jgi:protein arginine kinase
MSSFEFTSSGEWLRGSGPESDIVISSRIRLARNVQGYPFVTRLGSRRRQELEDFLGHQIAGLRSRLGLDYQNLKNAPMVDRLLLMERHLISREHVNTEGDRGVAFTSEEAVSVMTNEEDHLRIQVLRSGLELEAAWEVVERIDEGLGEAVPYAFDGNLGFLTACPTNVGTGMRVSVMLHLPALVLTRQVQKVFHAVTKIHLAVRGLYGEGTMAFGDFYQISNQITLGRTEREIIQGFKSLVPRIIVYERKVRERMVDDNKTRLKDTVARAFGILKNAETISSEETMDLLSKVRLGVNLGLISDIRISRVNELFILTQPAHLQKLEGRDLAPQDRDVVRAGFLRKHLQN